MSPVDAATPRPGAECHCVIHEPPDDSTKWDDGDRKLVADVERHGWGVFGIEQEGNVPGWAFTAGLWHTFASPELSMFGLRVPDMQQWLNDAGEQIRNGELPSADELREGILPSFPVTFRPVHESWYRELFGYALWFTQRPPLPIVQIVWPDREGRFPWDPDCGERCRLDQPQLWLPMNDHPMGLWTLMGLDDPWPFPDDRSTIAFTTSRIAHEGRPVTRVLHDAASAWWFLDGETIAGVGSVALHLGHVIGAHPLVAEVGDLPPGWEAWLQTNGEWIRQPIREGQTD